MKTKNNNIVWILVCVVAALGGGLFWWFKRKKSVAVTAQTAAIDAADNAAPTKAIGYRINNPLNIRYSTANNWKGQTGEQSGFCVFDTPENGLRAAMVNLKSYRKKGVITIGDIISRWAPPTENNTQNYIDFVCKKLGAAASYEVEQTASEYIALLQAMCVMEIGCQPYEQSIWEKAANMANL